MKILETAALADEVYFAFIDLAAKYSDRFSFEMNVLHLLHSLHAADGAA